MKQYVIYAQGPEHEMAYPIEARTCRRVIRESLAEKFTAREAQGKINILKFNSPDWTFEMKEMADG